MSERPCGAPGLNEALAILRQRWIAVGAAIAFGLLAGAACTAAVRPMSESQALVVLPAAAKGTPAPATFVTRHRVLAAAFHRVGSAVAPQVLRGSVQVTAMMPSVLSVVASAPSAARARTRANVVAGALVAYLSAPASDGRPGPARVLGKAVDIADPSFLARMVFTCGSGGLAAGFCGVVMVLAYDRRRREGSRRRAGLTDFRFLAAALRRGVWASCVMTAAGLALGAALYGLVPTTYQASATVLITRSPFILPAPSMAAETAWSRSPAVAAAAMRRLGLTQSVSSFLHDYTLTAVSSSALLVTASASSSDAAVRRAAAIASAFLQARASLLADEASLRMQALGPALASARQQEQAASAQLRAKAASARERKPLAVDNRTRARYAHAAQVLTALRGEASDDMTTLASMTGGSAVLGAIPAPQSRVRAVVLCLGAGLTGGLTVGVAATLIAALASDRLRRRDDVAMALGAPVSMSAGGLRTVGGAPGRRGLAAARNRTMRRVVRHLRDTLMADPARAGLVLVPAGRPKIAAMLLAALAVACAGDGLRVVLADLCDGGPAARLLGVTAAGIHEVRIRGSRLTVVIPDRHTDFNDACRSADVVVGCLTTGREPGAEILARWADRAVLLVKSGQPSAASLRSAGAMIGNSGMTLHSAIMIGADRGDLSLGIARTSLVTANLI